jgi:hypothetical protein
VGITSEPEDEFDIMGDIFHVGPHPIYPFTSSREAMQISPANDAAAKHPPLVRVTGRPSNIVEGTGSFDINVIQWISFPNQKVPFFWTGRFPQGWKHKPVPNPNNLKFVGVSGILTGIETSGDTKKFHVEIASVTFLGPAPPAYTAKGQYFCFDPSSMNRTDFSSSVDADSKRKAKGCNKLRRQTHSDKESSHLKLELYRIKYIL